MKLYVNNYEIGEFSVFMGDCEINLKQMIFIESEESSDDIIQIFFYYPDWGEFCAIYCYMAEQGNGDYYLIDSRKIPEDASEYHAIKLDDNIDLQMIDKVAIRLILEDW
jgi:hypothetical protein